MHVFMSSVKGYFCEFLISNIIGYLSFLRDQISDPSNTSTMRKLFILIFWENRLLKSLLPTSETLAILHRAIWVYVFIGITLSGYIVAQEQDDCNPETCMNLNH